MESEYIKRLKDIGIDITIKKNIWKFNEKMKLAQQAVDEGITLSFSSKNVGIDFSKFIFHSG